MWVECATADGKLLEMTVEAGPRKPMWKPLDKPDTTKEASSVSGWEASSVLKRLTCRGVITARGTSILQLCTGLPVGVLVSLAGGLARLTSLGLGSLGLLRLLAVGSWVTAPAEDTDMCSEAVPGAAVGIVISTNLFALELRVESGWGGWGGLSGTKRAISRRGGWMNCSALGTCGTCLTRSGKLPKCRVNHIPWLLCITSCCLPEQLHTHARTHARTHTHAHAHTHAHTCTHMHADTHADTHALGQGPTLAYIMILLCFHCISCEFSCSVNKNKINSIVGVSWGGTHTHTHTHAHTHAHAHAHTRTHARTHTHTHTPTLSLTEDRTSTYDILWIGRTTQHEEDNGASLCNFVNVKSNCLVDGSLRYNQKLFFPSCHSDSKWCLTIKKLVASVDCLVFPVGEICYPSVLNLEECCAYTMATVVNLCTHSWIGVL